MTRRSKIAALTAPVAGGTCSGRVKNFAAKFAKKDFGFNLPKPAGGRPYA